MPAYVVGMTDVTNPEKMQEYVERFGPTLEPYGGRFVGGGGAEVVEGDLSFNGVGIIAFESPEEARRWYDSPEYREVRELRHAAGSSAMLLVTSGQ